MTDNVLSSQAIPVWRVLARRNDRTAYSDLDSLAASIKKDGLIQPMVMRPIPRWIDATGRQDSKPFDGASQALELVAGQRRFRAITTILKLTEIPADWINVREMDDRTADDLMLMENSERVDLNPMDISDSYQYRVERYSMTVEDLCVLTKKTGSHVRLMLSLQRLTPEIQELVRQELFPVTFAEFLVNLAPEVQRQALRLYTRLDGNMTRVQWRTYVQELEKQAHDDETEQLELLTAFWEDQIGEQKFSANGRNADLGDVPINRDAPDVHVLRSQHDHAGAIIYRYIKALEADERHQETAGVLGKLYEALVFTRKVRVPAPTLQ